MHFTDAQLTEPVDCNCGNSCVRNQNERSFSMSEIHEPELVKDQPPVELKKFCHAFGIVVVQHILCFRHSMLA